MAGAPELRLVDYSKEFTKYLKQSRDENASRRPRGSSHPLSWDSAYKKPANIFRCLQVLKLI